MTERGAGAGRQGAFRRRHLPEARCHIDPNAASLAIGRPRQRPRPGYFEDSLLMAPAPLWRSDASAFGWPQKRPEPSQGKPGERGVEWPAWALHEAEAPRRRPARWQERSPRRQRRAKKRVWTETSAVGRPSMRPESGRRMNVSPHHHPAAREKGWWAQARQECEGPQRWLQVQRGGERAAQQGGASTRWRSAGRASV